MFLERNLRRSTVTNVGVENMSLIYQQFYKSTIPNAQNGVEIGRLLSYTSVPVNI